MKYKVAVIGTGYMAKKHCDTLYKHKDVILDTIVSTKSSQRLSKQFMQNYNDKYRTKLAKKKKSIVEQNNHETIYQ